MVTHPRFHIFVMTLAVVLSTVPAARAADQTPVRNYADCIERVDQHPEQGLEQALAWKDFGGGEAAEHCIILAMTALEYYDVAARRLEMLGQTLRRDAASRAQVLAQAGQAWLLAENPQRAEAALTAALGLAPGHPGHLIDRARARAALDDYKGAIADLDIAIASDPSRPEAYVFRAAARRYLGQNGPALADVEAALRLAPNHPEALLERGILKRIAGDEAGARQDWLRLLEVAPDGEAARLARANIERMDVKPEK